MKTLAARTYWAHANSLLTVAVAICRSPVHAKVGPMNDDLVETGLVAAAVTMREPELPPTEADPIALPAAVEAGVVPRVNMPDGWSLHTVAALVTDVAQNMYDLPYLLKKHKLTTDQYAYLQNNEFFKRALEAETITWQGTNSIQKRLALEAAIAVESALPTVAARLSKSTEPLADVVSLLKVLSEIAGTIGAKAAAPGASGEKFKIVINLGADTLQKEAHNEIKVISGAEESASTRGLTALVSETGEPRKNALVSTNATSEGT